jgi:hydrogenase maturation protease
MTDGLTDPSLGWDEAVERSHELQGLIVGNLRVKPTEVTLDMDSPALPEGNGNGARVRLRVILRISADRIGDRCKLRVEVENETLLAGGSSARRDEALPCSLVSAHVLLGIGGGEFESMLDPREDGASAVAACQNVGVFPVLVGVEPDRSMMLCSPIILYDYPQIAPESEGDFFDGTEMDEMLTLRVLTLTDAEKQEMREGDPRARRILERTEALTPDEMLQAHGVVRSMREIREEAPFGE